MKRSFLGDILFMSTTQLHNTDIIADSIYNSHINANAQIAGSKITPATPTTYGTTRLANDKEEAAGKVVQSNDTRMHEQGTDAGTTGVVFVVNTDHDVGENTTIELHSSSPNKGGKIRYNESLSRLQKTDNANAAIPTWEDFSNLNSDSDITITGKWVFGDSLKLPTAEPTPFTEGMAYWNTTLKNLMIHDGTSAKAIGGGILYVETLKGNQAVDAPANTTYTIPNGSFDTTGSNLLLVVNSQIRHKVTDDFSISSETTIVFDSAMQDTDDIIFIVFSKGVNQDGHIADTDIGTTSKTFRVGTGANETTDTFLLPFGQGGSSFVGFKVVSGTVQVQHAGASPMTIGSLNTASNYALTGSWMFNKDLYLPSYTTATRPSPQKRMIIYNDTKNKPEYYNGTDWIEI